MTDRELLALYRERMDQLKNLKRVNHPLGMLPLEQRDRIDLASARFRTADKAIVRELIARGAPANLKGITLRLTRDKQNFIALEPGTERPVGWEEVYVRGYGIRSLLYRGATA